MANQNRSNLQSTISSLLADNTSELISEGDLRTVTTNLSDSHLSKIDDSFVRTVAATTGTEPAYVITLTNNYPAAYDTTIPIIFQAHATSTGAATLNINSIGAKDILRPDGTATQAGDIVSGQWYMVNYDSGADDFEMFKGFGGSTTLPIDGNVLIARRTITSSEILNSFDTPIEIIAAPGAGKFIEILSVTGSMDYNSSVYTIPGSTFVGNYLGFDGVLTSASDGVSSGSQESYFPVINGAINFSCTSSNPTGGNSDLKVKIRYTIESI